MSVLMISLAGINFNRGMGRYIKMFLPYLCNEFRQNLFIVSNKEIPKELFQIIKSSNSVYLEKKMPYPIFEQFLIPYLIKKYKVKVAYFPANTFPILKPHNTKYIVTIHDLIFLDKNVNPKILRQKIGKLYRAFVVKNGIKKVDLITTVSKTVLKSIESTFNIRIDDTNIIYNPIDFDSVKKYDDKILNMLNLEPKKFLYTISGTADNKNFEFVLKSFSNLKKFCKDIKLVVSGIIYPDNLKYTHMLNALSIKEDVIFTPYVTDEQKNSLMKHCKAFLFLSKAEGFGIPIIEALCQNATVIASDIEVFKEIGNKYIYYVDVKNENCLVDLFIGNNLPKNNPNEVMAYLKSKFDVRILAEKLISKIYEILEE